MIKLVFFTLLVFTSACRLDESFTRGHGKLKDIPDIDNARDPAKTPSPPGSSLPGGSTGFISWDYQRDYVDLDKLKSRISFRTIDDKTILLDFDRKNAPRHHPRLMADEGEFERLKMAAKGSDSFFLESLSGVLKRAEKQLQSPLPSYEHDANTASALTFSDEIIVLSFAYRMTGDGRFSNKVRYLLLSFSDFKDWNPSSFLAVGLISSSVAIGYDWTYETLDASQRKTVVTAMLEKGLKAGLNAIKYNASWNTTSINWNPVCNGGLAIAALAILDEGYEARTLGSTLLVKVIEGVSHYIRAFEPDGQSVESLHYWNFGVTNLIHMLESMRTALGTDYDFSNTNGLARASVFPILMSGPAAGIFINDGPLRNARTDSNFWFAKKYKNRTVANHHYNEIKINNSYASTTIEDMLFYDPSLIDGSAPSEFSLPLDNYLRDIEYVGFRSSWDLGRAIFTGIHAGTNKGAHAHLGASSFDIQAHGKVFALGGLGSDNYTLPGYFSNTHPGYKDPRTVQEEAGRYHIYRIRAEGKNQVAMNPDIRPEQDPLCEARIERIDTNQDEAIAEADLTPCYNRDATLYNRRLALLNKRTEIELQDRITTKNNATLYWFMHTPASVSLDQSGRKAELTVDNEIMFAELTEPSATKFTIMDSVYLPEELFPLSQNSPNAFAGRPVKKLVIKLVDFGDGKIVVKFKFPSQIAK